MTMPTNDNKDNMIFTLEDGQSSGSAEHYSDWEHSLDQLRHIRGSDAGADSALTRPVARTAEELQRDEVKLFGDAELESAYREFLRQNEAEHNARVEQQGAEEDVGILIQEDWLNAQIPIMSAAKTTPCPKPMPTICPTALFPPAAAKRCPLLRFMFTPCRSCRPPAASACCPSRNWLRRWKSG